MNEETLYAATVESLEVPIDTPADPTAEAPQFALSTVGAVTPGSFSAGAWHADGYSATTGKTTAITPTLGSTGTLAIASGTSYTLWAKVTLGSEVAVWPVGRIRCP
jgi:hypothetical protein